MPAAAVDCVPVSAWVYPDAPGKPVAPAAVAQAMAGKSAVLLGELHDNPEHHRWQLHTLAALHALHPAMVLGFEMFPRRVQPALDRWVAGELSESEFLTASDWRNVWGYDAAMYLPLFHYARMHRIPMVALDVPRREHASVATRPAPPAPGYRDMLRRIQADHPAADLERFVQSQALHDRVLAQSIAQALSARPGALLVGILGSGHVRYGYGVPHQLKDLGVPDVGILLAWDQGDDCAMLAGVADAVFGVAAPRDAGRPHLGVVLDTNGGVRIGAVETNSIAEVAGLRVGDVLLEVAGLPVKGARDVRAAVERQAPGTWLPLKVRRGDETLDIVAKFPPLAHAATPHYDLDVRIDPAARTLEGRGVLSVPPARAQEVALAPRFDIESREQDNGRLDIRWRGALAETAFLPGESGWYPRMPDELASYELTVELPAGHVGVAPGRLVQETNAPDRYRARFAFADPGEAIDLMIGPYRIAERMHRSASGKALRLRTYFHPEIETLAPGYLDSVAEYLDLYERRIGAYPYDGFSVVSSPTPTGYGMASLTYLGIDVLKLPFIRATSLGHEVLHNWWGNGVYVDYAQGNWAEGLTTFMADYAYREREGAAQAREMRLGWLRDISAVPPGRDEPLAAFRSRTHETSQIVGYRKTAMVFYMLREMLGADTFEQALREFWRTRRFRVAAWSDLERAFAAAAGRDLSAFFSQWLTRPGVPAVRIASARTRRQSRGWRTTVTLTQDAPPFALRVPVVVDGKTTHVVDLRDPKSRFDIETTQRPRAIALDPELCVLRRLAPDEAPPILRGVMVAPSPGVLVLSDALAQPADRLARRLFDGEPEPQRAALVIGLHADVDAWLARERLARPPDVARKGTAQVWMVRRRTPPLAVVSVRDADALAALLRPLPHYGAQSFIVFRGSKAVERGVWPARPQTVRVTG